MEDRELVAAIAAGDPNGLSGAYDKYAESLYGYCQWMLPEAADAAEAARNTFALAAVHLGNLRDASQVRPWLFTTARHQCQRRPQTAAAQAAVLASTVLASTVSASTVLASTGVDAGEVGQDAEAGSREAERAELQKVIRYTLAELAADEREAVQLSLWHGLDDADLSAVLGVSGSRAHALASTGRLHLEQALGALRIARAGRDHCPELDTLLADWDGQLNVPTLKLVGQHIAECEICSGARHGKLRPAALSQLLPLAEPPPELREQVLGLYTGTGTAGSFVMPENFEVASDSGEPESPGERESPGELGDPAEDLEGGESPDGVGSLDDIEVSGGPEGSGDFEDPDATQLGLQPVQETDEAPRATRLAAAAAVLAGLRKLAGWGRIRRKPKVAAAVIAVLIAAAVSIPLLAVSGAHAVRDLGSQSGGTAGTGGTAAGTASGRPAASDEATRSPAQQDEGNAATNSRTHPAAKPSKKAKPLPSDTPAPLISPEGSGPPPSPSPSSTASPHPSHANSPAPSSPASPTPTPPPSPSPSPAPTSS